MIDLQIENGRVIVSRLPKIKMFTNEILPPEGPAREGHMHMHILPC